MTPWRANRALGVGMNKYILIAFAVMGVGFYEISGGPDFVPGSNSLVVFAKPKPAAPEPEPVEQSSIVARANLQPPTFPEPVQPREIPARRTDPSPRPLVQVPSLSEAMVDLAPAPAIPLTTDAAPVAVAPPEEDVDAVVAAVIAEVAAPEPVADPEPVPDLRFVDGDRVNMRGGPGTDFAVVGRLLRNDIVEVLKDEGNGWLHLRVPATGEEGWMADWLVTAAN